MIHELEPSRFGIAHEVCAGHDFHVAARAILGGSSQARVWVDDPERPAAAFLAPLGVCYLAGTPEPEFARDLGRTIDEELDRPFFSIVVDQEGWDERLPSILLGLEPIVRERHCYRYEGETPVVRTPDGYEIATVDAALRARPDLEPPRGVSRSMDETFFSRDDFFERGLGALAFHGDEFAGFCITNVAHEDACELGAMVEPPHRRRGLALALTREVVRRARERGMAEVELHGRTDNVPSMRTAARAGFTFRREYRSHTAVRDLGVHYGSLAHRAEGLGEYEAALAHLERAAEHRDHPHWAWMVSARAHAHLGHHAEALRSLEAGLAAGFPDILEIRNDDAYASLRDIPGFDAILERVESA